MILSEELMHACRIPADYLRPRYGFESLPDFDAGLWKRARKEADAKIRALPPGLIAGSDTDAAAAQAARTNLARLPHRDQIRVRRAGMAELDGIKETTLMMNPPYGNR